MRLAPWAIAAPALATLAATLLAPAAAEAGGVGALATGGVYSERVWYYDSNEVGYTTRKAVPTVGSGIDLMLGGRDDRIVGIARFYWEMSAPEPDISGQTDFEGVGPYTFPRRDSSANAGVFAVGLQGGLVGDPEKAMLTIQGTVGSGFMTTDRREYVFGEVGVGGTYRLGRTVEAYANLNGHMRFRKWARLGGTGYAGVRVLFD